MIKKMLNMTKRTQLREACKGLWNNSQIMVAHRLRWVLSIRKFRFDFAACMTGWIPRQAWNDEL